MVDNILVLLVGVFAIINLIVNSKVDESIKARRLALMRELEQALLNKEDSQTNKDVTDEKKELNVVRVEIVKKEGV